jgi:hypothetical protein
VDLEIKVDQSTIKDAELIVSIRDGKKMLPRALRSGEPVSWKERQFERVELVSLLAGRRMLPREIRANRFNQHEKRLKSGTGNFATLLFTIEDQKEAYLTTKEFQLIPLGYRYTVDVNLIGENLAESHRKSFYLELYDWNDIHFGVQEWPHYHPIHDLLKRKPRLKRLTA